MNYIFSFLFPILLLAMGGYVLFSAIKGEGRLFSMENFKEEHIDQAKKYMRILYFALAAILLLTALTNGLNTILYSNRVSFFKLSDEYTTSFKDMYDPESGKLYVLNTSGELAEFKKDESGNKVVYTDADEQQTLPWYNREYSIYNEKMDQTICINGFIQNAYYMYGKDTSKFPQVKSSAGLMSCMGGGTSVKFTQYLHRADLMDENNEPVYTAKQDDQGNPLYTDAEKAAGHEAYFSYFSKTRSDEKSDKFVVKLYGAFSQTLLTVLNYVFLGLAILGVIALFLVTRKFTDKEKLKKARSQQVHPAMPSDAFNFDDEEPKQNAMKDDK